MLLLSAAPGSPNLADLARRGRILGASWSSSATGRFAFESAFIDPDTGRQRSWANWLLADRLMIGQYPHCQPAPGPSAGDAEEHLQRVLDAGITCFACLQAELPPQDEEAAWPHEGGVQLPSPEDRKRWPDPFIRYAPLADAIASETEGRTLRYLHYPIADLAVPPLPTLLDALDGLLGHFEGGGNAVCELSSALRFPINALARLPSSACTHPHARFWPRADLHCWGGRGRAGVVGGCFLALLRPELEASAVLEAVQTAYDSRAGADAMATQLKRSPQTEAQRSFVRSFVSAARAAQSE